MTEIIMCVGMQASGKSTWAKDFVKEHQDFKRVSRDDIRHMTNGYVFNKQNENLVTVIERGMMHEVLASGFNLVIDKMNLNEKDLEEDKAFLMRCGALNNINIEFTMKEFPVTLDEALKRDKNREFPIGPKVLQATWSKYQEKLVKMLNIPKVVYDNNLRDAVIFDADGTLCINDGHRNAFDFSKVLNDKPNKLIIEQAHFHKNQKRTIIVVSGRDDNCQNDTEKWLVNYNVPYDMIFMRKTGDKRKDVIIKKELYETYIKDKFNIIAIYDDRPQVIRGWRELGFFVFDVGKGVEF